MIDVTLSDVATAVSAATAPTDLAPDAVTGSVVHDSREVGPGDLFVAIAGERTDGHMHVAAALEAGAVGALVDNPERAKETGADPARLVVVGNTQQALGDLARYVLAEVRQRPNPPLVIAVTGSVGKTTTKDLLAGLMAPRGDLIAPPGSLNNEIGLPLTVLRVTDTTATLVLEMGADRVGNLEYLTSIAPPDIAVVLAVGHAHLGEFGGIDNVARAKTELVAGLAAGGLAVLNADDHRVAAMASATAGPVISFSAAGATGAHVRANDADPTRVRATFTLTADGVPTVAGESVSGSQRLTLALIGHHHTTNALAAAATALAAGQTVDEVAEVLSAERARSPHRTDLTEFSNGTVVLDDSYNANPDSMAAGLTTFATAAGSRRRVAVLGSMLELGEDSHQAHQRAGRLAAKSTDVLVTMGLEANDIADGARQGGLSDVTALGQVEPREVAQRITSDHQPGDALFFKGSRGSRVWEVADLVIDSLADANCEAAASPADAETNRKECTAP